MLLSLSGYLSGYPQHLLNLSLGHSALPHLLADECRGKGGDAGEC